MKDWNYGKQDMDNHPSPSLLIEAVYDEMLKEGKLTGVKGLIYKVERYLQWINKSNEMEKQMKTNISLILF